MGGTDHQLNSPTRVAPQKKNKWTSFRLFMGKILNSIKRPFQKPLSGTSLHTGRAQRSTSGNEGYRAQRPVSNGIAFSEPTPTRPALPPLCNVSTQMMSSPDPLSPRPISKRKTRPATEYQRVCKRHKPNEVVHASLPSSNKMIRAHLILANAFLSTALRVLQNSLFPR
ncbi:hypothetical protein BASA81_013477 [Batrachochytrium salamandrivorans]|nr:hypothetical protein BASA81_013477 [Batrachochytrium salamandrivorans]